MTRRIRRRAAFGNLWQKLRIRRCWTIDPEGADRFVEHTLGELETAPPEITETLRVFIAEQCNATRAAARLFTHRNTLLRRLARADQLLPRPLAQRTIEVGTALKVLQWRGHP
ncbi:PucR family transcriptional regulator [Streptomyces sp. NPDC003863]